MHACCLFYSVDGLTFDRTNLCDLKRIEEEIALCEDKPRDTITVKEAVILTFYMFETGLTPSNFVSSFIVYYSTIFNNGYSAL